MYTLNPQNHLYVISAPTAAYMYTEGSESVK